MENPYVMTEPVRIREILVNILNNAVKFTNDGGTIRLDVSNRPGSRCTAQGGLLSSSGYRSRYERGIPDKAL